jgi:hypothetical protein
MAESSRPSSGRLPGRVLLLPIDLVSSDAPFRVREKNHGSLPPS